MAISQLSGAGTRFTAVLGIHVLVIAAIAQMNPEVKRALMPIVVSFITPAGPLPQVSIPRPRPVMQTMASPAPVAPVPSPAPVTESLPHAISVPTPQRAPEPAPATPVPPTVVIAAPAPLPVVAPRFDAAYLNNPAPVYPALSRRLGERGRVLLRVYVNADGTTRDIQMRTPSGSARLDQAAREAVERWRFVPARQGDEAVGAWVLVPISFQLEG